MSTTIAYDIEVAGYPWEEVDEITRAYLLQRARTEEAREAVPERTALFPGLGKIITIGMWNLEMDRGLVLLEGDSHPSKEWERVPKSDIIRGEERELLEHFWKILDRKRPRLVSFNGRTFDGPMLMIRSAQLGVTPTKNLVGNRYRMGDLVDLLEVFTFMGAVRDRYSLDYWCRRFDIESPKGSIDGSQVARAYREGRIEEIGEYCLRDVRATGALYKRVEKTILPLL
ncbi:MAG TPA: 3'-5' exonuclease [Planctomycetes bacterium]|nr:3'-5' exonuclease [Planctomycetota bacterium]